jgi:hypothetical protein
MGRLVVGAVLAILLAGCRWRARPTFEYEAPVTTISTAERPEPAPAAASAPRPADADPAAASPPPEAVPPATVPPQPSVWRRSSKW